MFSKFLLVFKYGEKKINLEASSCKKTILTYFHNKENESLAITFPTDSTMHM